MSQARFNLHHHKESNMVTTILHDLYIVDLTDDVDAFDFTRLMRVSYIAALVNWPVFEASVGDDHLVYIAAKTKHDAVVVLNSEFSHPIKETWEASDLNLVKFAINRSIKKMKG